MQLMNRRQLSSDHHDRNRRLRRLGRYAFAILLIAAAIGVGLSGVKADSFALWLESMGLQKDGFGARVVFFFLGLILVSIVLPKTVVSLAAGAIFGTWSGGILIALISVAAAALNYAIGRWWLKNSLDRRLAGLIQPADESQPRRRWPIALHEMASEAGYGFHLLFRFASIPSMMLNYFMGAVGARIAPFMTAVVIGILPQLLWVHGASIAATSSGNVSQWQTVSSIVSIIAAVVVAIIVPHQVMRRIERMQ